MPSRFIELSNISATISRRSIKFPAALTEKLSLLALFAVITLTACGGLGGEPRIVSTLPPPRTPTPVIEAAIVPNPSAGQATFELQCASCHGVGGAGDGELVIAGSVPQMVSFTSADVLHDITPQAWFDIITEGRIENLMPPWANALTPRERWDVTGYIFGLRYDPADITLGETLWATHCEACPMIAPEAALQQSDADLFDLLGDLLDTPLSDDERWAIVAYMRMQGAAGVEVAASTPEVIRGIVVNGSRDDVPVVDTPVTLFAVNSRFEVTQHEATTDADGQVLFDDIPTGAGYTYAVGVTHEERLFFSDFTRAAGGEMIDVPLTIYDLTDDSSHLTIIDMLYQVTPVEGGAQILQAMTFRNDSDRAYSTNEQVDENVFTSVRVPLPRDSFWVQTPESDNRYIFSESPFMVVDTIPVLPGEMHTIQTMFFVPAVDSALVAQPLEYDLQGEVRLVLHPATMHVQSDQLMPVIEEAERPTSRYSAVLDLNAGEIVRFELRRLTMEPESDTDNLWLLVLISLGVGVLTFIGGVYLVNRFVVPD